MGGTQYPDLGDDGAHEGSRKVEATFQERKIKQTPVGLWRLKEKQYCQATIPPHPRVKDFKRNRHL